MVDQFSYSKSWTLGIMASFLLFQPSNIIGQDVSELATRANINLYEIWNFDSAAYYFNKMILKNHVPASAYAHYGWYLMIIDKGKESLTYLRKAATMNPNDRQLVAWYAWGLLWKDDVTLAKGWIDKAMAIDPEYGETLHVGSRIASKMENHQEAIKLAEKAAAQDPIWRAGIPLALANAGHRKQALQWAQKIAIDESVYDAMLLMEVYAVLRIDDQALAYLQKSYDLRHIYMPWIKSVPALEHLHEDLKFKTIVDKMNLPQ